MELRQFLLSSEGRGIAVAVDASLPLPLVFAITITITFAAVELTTSASMPRQTVLSLGVFPGCYKPGIMTLHISVMNYPPSSSCAVHSSRCYKCRLCVLQREDLFLSWRWHHEARGSPALPLAQPQLPMRPLSPRKYIAIAGESERVTPPTGHIYHVVSH